MCVCGTFSGLSTFALCLVHLGLWFICCGQCLFSLLLTVTLTTTRLLSVEGPLAPALVASLGAPSKVAPWEVLVPRDPALLSGLVEGPGLGGHAVAQEGWELAPTPGGVTATSPASSSSTHPTTSSTHVSGVGSAASKPSAASPPSRGALACSGPASSSLATGEGVSHVLPLHLSSSVGGGAVKA